MCACARAFVTVWFAGSEAVSSGTSVLQSSPSIEDSRRTAMIIFGVGEMMVAAQERVTSIRPDRAGPPRKGDCLPPSSHCIHAPYRELEHTA